jgi:chemotaxis protein CheD
MIVMNQRTINVGLGELTITNDVSAILTCNGLGSCIALCIYDPISRMGGMAHMLLPACRSKNDLGSLPSKYINTGTPILIERMQKQGAQKQNLIVKIAGGAKMLSIPGNCQLDIGQKNIAEVKTVLFRENLTICGADVGGGFGRSVRFQVDCGRILVKSVSGRILDL